jgi:hypothetical protein
MTFNQNEERDPHGRWTAGGGGSGVYDKLTVNSILNDPTSAKPGSRANDAIAKELNARGQAALKELGIPNGVINPPKGKEASDPKADNIVSSAIASEIENELSRGVDKHAENWYTSKMKEAMGIAEKMHPEMVDNPAAKFAFTAAMAITSQNQTVQINTALADKVYDSFSKTGKFPTDVKAGKAGIMINNNFDKLNKLIGTMGSNGAQKFLDKEFTVGELKKLGYVVTGENLETKVYGSAILGPKIGQGFYQNLNGNFKPLTADMWLMRSWGRLTGTLMGTVDVTKPQARYEAALKAAGEKVPANQAGLVSKAEDLRLTHTRDFKYNREQFDSGKKTKSELVYAAERYEEAINGIKDQPTSGGERQRIRDVFDQAQQKLADAGHKMTIADMQATWWYPEKRLYSKMGSRNTERLNTDYATELRKMAIEKGVKL